MPPDEPICTEVNPSKGFCVKIMSGEQFVISDSVPYKGKTWWEVRPSLVMMPVQTWAELKKWIIKICKNNSQCNQVAHWERSVNVIDERLADD